jgi:hypothetical protein
MDRMSLIAPTPRHIALWKWFYAPIYGAPVRQLVVAQIDPFYRRAEQASFCNHRYTFVRHPIPLYEYLRERLGRRLPPRIMIKLATLHDRPKESKHHLGSEFELPSNQSPSSLEISGLKMRAHSVNGCMMDSRAKSVPKSFNEPACKSFAKNLDAGISQTVARHVQISQLTVLVEQHLLDEEFYLALRHWNSGQDEGCEASCCAWAVCGLLWYVERLLDGF